MTTLISIFVVCIMILAVVMVATLCFSTLFVVFNAVKDSWNK